MKFDIHSRCGLARHGTMTFRRGTVQTPAFMPVGTYGTVKGVTPEEIAACERGETEVETIAENIRRRKMGTD